MNQLPTKYAIFYLFPNFGLSWVFRGLLKREALFDYV